MGKDDPTLDECLEMATTCASYNLRRASRAVTQVFDAYFEAVGLKSTQFTLLAALSYERVARPTITDLAHALVLDQSSLSRNLAVLQREGLVKLTAGADKRERVVLLTRAGRAALARGYPVWKEAQRAVAGAIDPKDFETHLRTLRRLTNSVKTLRPVQAPNMRKSPSKSVSRAP